MLKTLLSRLHGVRKNGSGWSARCPAHEDTRPSLSVGRGDDGRILLHCHRGCPVESVVSALGLVIGDLATAGDNGDGEIIATYDYKNEGGRLLFQVVRKTGKRFAQRRPNPDGGWIWNLKDTRRVPYRLPELLAADPAEPVFVPEGEQDVDRLARLGIVATCNPGGAGKWKAAYGEVLSDRSVVVLVDNDDAGRKHGETVARSLRRRAASVKVLELPGLPDKGDVSDWLANGGTADELRRLAADCPLWTPTENVATPTAALTGEPHLTDLGNAQRLVKRYGASIRYCYAWSKWLAWDGKRWKLDDVGTIEQHAMHTVKTIWQEAASGEGTAEERKALAGHALRSEAAARVSAMIQLARSEVPILPEHLDQDPWLLNVQNGTLDLRRGVLRKHDRRDFITKLAPVAFDPAEECPTWLAFLERIFDRNANLIGFMQRLLGYCLTGSTRTHVLPILYGRGANGKSTLLTTIMDIMGPDYAVKAPPDLLMIRRGEHHPTERADLFGKRLVATVETAEGGRLNESLIKDLTGGDTQKARRLYEDFWQFKPTHKLLLATNHRPVVKDTTCSTWRRLRLIPFTVEIPVEEQDEDLGERMVQTEAPGVLRWMVDGCLDWQQRKLAEPPEVLTATEEYRTSQDPIAAFLAECCVIDRTQRERASTLYDAYKRWAEREGEDIISQTKFGSALTEKEFGREKANVTWRTGLALKTDDWGE